MAINVGDEVTVEGQAGDAKLGAVIASTQRSYYIDGMGAWPEGVAGQQVRVTGRYITREDLPVVTYEPGEPIRAGVVAPPGMPEPSRTRHLITDVQWETTEPSP